MNISPEKLWDKCLAFISKNISEQTYNTWFKSIVFEAFNEVFDCLPLCAVLDESIYCAHGGIPSCALKLEQILTVQCPLPDPDNDSDIAMEILWNSMMSSLGGTHVHGVVDTSQCPPSH